MALFTSEQRALCDDVSRRFRNLIAWYRDPANANKPAIAKIKANEGLLQGGLDCSVLWTDPTDVINAKGDLEILELFAIKDGFPKPVNYSKPIDTTAFVAGSPTVFAAAQKIEDAVKKFPTLDYATDPAYGWFGDPSKKAKESAYQACLKSALPEAWCDYKYKDKIPWWVYAVGVGGAVGFSALLYASFKAAPYVMPYVVPGSAPFAQAWQAARQGAPPPGYPPPGYPPSYMSGYGLPTR